MTSEYYNMTLAELYNMTLAELGEYFSLSPETLLSEVENWFGRWEIEKFVDNLIRTYDLDISEFVEEDEEEEVEEEEEEE